ncbi:DUF2807 domain-containing protein [Archangium violaceum]|uniref:head GIN domain-containing protein n=1 Tax=Archangium violaceum TaxID=83451 RepID=UPI00193BD16A|nr:head GIN domain-containing protein [Archangium violaceum]QRK06444.1 DUF2807 domain-containing protein [Archangium violaceum]
MQLRSHLLPALLLVSAPVLAQDAAANGGQIDVPDFHEVAVSHGIHAEVKPGPKSVRLEGNADELSRVKLEVRDGVLTTKVEKSGMFFSKGLKDVRLYVTNPRVEGVTASGGSHVNVEATRVESFEVRASGGSQLRITDVDARELDVEASGGSQLSLKGRTDELEISASGGSVIEANKVQAESLEVEASGGSAIQAAPERSITGELSGGSMVKSFTKPKQVQVDSSGGSKVEYK